MKERRISLYTTDENAKQLKIIAARKGTTITALLNEAVNKIIKENKN